MLGSILRWEDNFYEMIRKDPLGQYANNLSSHGYVAEIEKIKSETGK